jgi:opacity protein-like surface antigen
VSIRNSLLATAAFAVLAGVQQAHADGMYVSVFGGANFQQDESHFAVRATTFAGSEAHNTDPDTGFVIGGAIGTGLDNWVKGLRVELEASYRRNDVGGDFQTGFYGGFYNSTGSIDANTSTFAIMANVAYDIEMGWKIKPYVMGGAGWARTRYEGAEIYTTGSTNTTFDVENSGFAWQLGAGFNYEVADGVDVGLGYRYFDGPDSSYFAGKNIAPINHDNTNHAVTVNLTIDTN